MKFYVSIKDPDGVSTSLQEEATEQINALEGLDDDEKEMLIEARQEKLSEFISSWIEYGECMTIIFDTEKDTAEVKKL
jgi:hypothetical protein